MADDGDALAQARMDHLGGNTPWPQPTEWWVRLHTGNPGRTGVANVATENTPKDFTLVGWDPAAFNGGSNRWEMTTSSSPVATWSSLPATETITWVSVWDGDPGSGGTHLFNVDVNDTPVAIGGTLTLDELTYAVPAAAP